MGRFVVWFLPALLVAQEPSMLFPRESVTPAGLRLWDFGPTSGPSSQVLVFVSGGWRSAAPGSAAQVQRVLESRWRRELKDRLPAISPTGLRSWTGADGWFFGMEGSVDQVTETLTSLGRALTGAPIDGDEWEASAPIAGTPADLHGTIDRWLYPSHALSNGGGTPALHPDHEPGEDLRQERTVAGNVVVAWSGPILSDQIEAAAASGFRSLPAAGPESWVTPPEVMFTGILREAEGLPAEAVTGFHLPTARSTTLVAAWVLLEVLRERCAGEFPEASLEVRVVQHVSAWRLEACLRQGSSDAVQVLDDHVSALTQLADVEPETFEAARARALERLNAADGASLSDAVIRTWALRKSGATNADPRRELQLLRLEDLRETVSLLRPSSRYRLGPGFPPPTRVPRFLLGVVVTLVGIAIVADGVRGFTGLGGLWNRAFQKTRRRRRLRQEVDELELEIQEWFNQEEWRRL